MPKRNAKTAPPRTRAAKHKPAPDEKAPGSGAGLTGSIRSLAGQMFDLAGAAVDASLGVGGLLVRDPSQRKDLARAGRFLRGVRERGAQQEEYDEAGNHEGPAFRTRWKRTPRAHERPGRG